MPKIRLILLMVIILSILPMRAHGKSDDTQSDDTKILARVNKYYLTVADFKSEMRSSLPDSMADADFEKAKEDLLDRAITKKILIQEAQKENFDKDRAFVREIEHYWEQALLKLLFKKKEQELLRKFRAGEGGEEARDKKVREAMNVWIEGLKKRADIERYENNLKAIKP